MPFRTNNMQTTGGQNLLLHRLIRRITAQNNINAPTGDVGRNSHRTVSTGLSMKFSFFLVIFGI